MTHPRGSITYNPAGQFNLPRSYCYDTRFYIQSVSSISMSGSLATMLYTPVPAFRGYVKFRDAWWDWNSNVYSLDWIVEYNYYINFSGDAEKVLPIAVGWASAGQTLRPSINVVFALGTVVHTFANPPAPSTYWVPPPPP